MNSRTNSGWGYQLPPENDFQIRGPWVPVTPEKPFLMRSNGIQIERNWNNQPGRTNWHEGVGISGRPLQQDMNYNGASQNFNLIGLMGQNGSSYNLGVPPAQTGSFSHSVSSYAQTFANDSEDWIANPLAELLAIKKTAVVAPANGMPNRSMNEANAPTILNSYSEVDSSWTEGNFTSLLLGDENPTACSNQCMNTASLLQIPLDGFPVPLRPNYNLNSPPRLDADANSSTTNSFPFAPVTPDHTKQFENYHSETLNLSVDESSSQEKDKPENLLTSIRGEAFENHSNELLQNIVDSASAAVCTLLKEKNSSDQDGDQGIDLNKTPQQKTPKRRKHRPKVIKEGKAKRTPKLTTPKATNSKENPSGKRKYVRKKSLQATGTKETDGANKVTIPTSESRARRMLNFDSENDKKGESHENNLHVGIHQEKQKNQAYFDLNLDFESTRLYSGVNSITGAEPDVRLKMPNAYVAEKHKAGSTCDLTPSINQMPPRSTQLPQECAPAGSPAAIKNNTLNAIATNVNTRNLTLYPSSKHNYSQGHHQGEIDQWDATQRNLNQYGQMAWKSYLQSRNMANIYERRLKRQYRQAVDQPGSSAENWVGSPFLHQETDQVHDHNNNGSTFGTGCSETHKKRRTENGFHTTVCNSPFVAIVGDGSGQTGTGGRNSAYANCYAAQTNARNSEGDKTCKKPKDGFSRTCGDSCFHSITEKHNLQKKLTTYEHHLNRERTMEKRSSGSTQVHHIASLTSRANLNSPSTTLSKATTSDYKHEMATFQANTPVKTVVAQSLSSLVASRTDGVLLQEHKGASCDFLQCSKKARGLPEKLNSAAIDEITCRLQGLKITGRSKTNKQEQNALVLYKGDGTIVPYERFDPIKKRRPRPKVDLDPETNRIWNLLMGKEGSEQSEAEDKGKERWWEEERKIFRGRADSFIARMHLVQGDRRFSRWKGSVVDSVIGVFLTQNVSDHLSSSAFMSLAARFPLQSTPTAQTCYQSGTSMLDEEPEVQMLRLGGTIKGYEKVARQPLYYQASAPPHISSVHSTKHLVSGTRNTPATDHHGLAGEQVSSSQDSSQSFLLQVNGKNQSRSGSSEAEISNSWRKSNNPPTAVLPMGRNSSFQVLHTAATWSSYFDDRSTHWQSVEDTAYNNQIPRLETLNYLRNSSLLSQPIIPHMQRPIQSPGHFQSHMVPELAAQEVHFFRRLRAEHMSPLPSTASGITEGISGSNGERVSKTISAQNKVPTIQVSPIRQPAFLAKHLAHQESSSQSASHTGKGQLSHNTHQQGSTRTFQLESTLVREPVPPTEAFATRQNVSLHQVFNDPQCSGQASGVERSTVADKQIFLENKAVDSNAKERVYFSGEVTSGISGHMLNAKKGKAGDDKRKAFDWDSLRRAAQPNGRSKQRSKDTLDSLDYEALWQADVNEISNAIRERGMNNMLAERIKDFLDRLVREHGSMDLEWLRDVPPDKAKDYLLSIRGLGLKSVECVRLLTLHHLAFPVDTNVGRIAVRLGWVPLQPLPESLQLHLLELYPILESIQKYLWPRLCKLDQRMLYELHYQMITFGKVFCTKSKPNCNACPMRGECRHFASAFASARLALPGLEEKSLVTSTSPIATAKSPGAAFKPMALPPAGYSEAKDMGTVVSKCQPIVEEPTTPEPEATEVSISDIEEAFYEDPDEIPTIKLNIEEFTLNLQNFMQEGDMSKALVALTPEAASIPTPKLKNVSRLRTEHQVYELPDSHTLLRGMDKREPDDPSPYLLAIWTPGETANSVQPPERSCASQESGKLCNEKTCFTCNSLREANAQTVRGTILIPCRTAMRGSFPLNGTYFQVNEVFADHESSLYPIDIPRAWIWNLPRRTVYFGTSVTSIFKGLPTEGIQFCFWRGFVCVRGFDQKARAPRPLMARLHFPASKLVKTKNDEQKSPNAEKGSS